MKMKAILFLACVTLASARTNVAVRHGRKVEAKVALRHGQNVEALRRGQKVKASLEALLGNSAQECYKDTYETCQILPCKKWRNAVCSTENKCLCPVGTCNEYPYGKGLYFGIGDYRHNVCIQQRVYSSLQDDDDN